MKPDFFAHDLAHEGEQEIASVHTTETSGSNGQPPADTLLAEGDHPTTVLVSEAGIAPTTPVTQRDMQAFEQRIMAALQDLREEFITKIRYDAMKDEQIRRLSNEAQEARDGSYMRMVRPLYMRLIDLYDDISTIIVSSVSAQGEMSQAGDTSFANLRSFRETVEQILAEQGVERYELSNDEFIAERQRTIKVIATNNSAFDKKVHDHLRPGFLYEGKTLRPEWVATYRYTPDEIEQ